MYENMNMMKKVLAVSSITVDSFGGDQSLRAWAKLNGFNFLMFNSVNAESERAMIAACEESALDVCKELFENVGSNKAILDCQNKQGETPMFMACKNGDLELCEWLHDHGDIELIIEALIIVRKKCR